MVSLAGMIHPRSFQTTEWMTQLNSRIHTPAIQDFQTTRYKNFEMHVSGGLLSYNEQHSIYVVIDGTLRNSEALVKEFQERGISLQDKTISTLIIRAYETWQENFLAHLNGDFIIVLFDEERELLYLIRDRLGKKNLYWSDQGETFLFSSDLKSVLSTGIVPQTPALESIASDLVFGFIPQDFSPIKGINKLLPGHFIKIDLKRRISIAPYWSLSQLFASKKKLQTSKALEEFQHLFETSVKASLPSEGRIGIFLSHSVGSALLNDYVSKNVTDKERIIRFSTDFDSSFTPEEMCSDLVKIVWYLEEPISDFQSLRIWHLCKLAQGKMHTILSDVGWSEFFAGDSRYFEWGSLSFSTSFWERTRNAYFLSLLRLVRHKRRWEILRHVDFNKKLMGYLVNSSLFKTHELKKVSPLLSRYFDPAVFTQRFHRLSSLPGEIDPFLYFDAKTALPDRDLLQYEKLLVPHSLSLNAPFLDTRLVEWITGLPEEIKFEKYVPGYLLHQVRTIREEHTSVQTKSDFFLEKWCLHPLFRELFTKLEKGFLVEEGLISARWIRQQLGYPYLIPHTFKQFWSILILEIWFRLYIAKPVGSIPLDVDVQKFL